MQTTIKEVGPAEYAFEIEATSEDLAPKLNKALRAQRSRTNMKGFRPGKVPLSLVKKMYGKAIGYQIAEEYVQDAYEAEVLEGDEYEVLGRPQLTELDFELDGDMRAVIRFAVRPDIELKDISEERITKLVHEVTDEEVEDAIEQVLQQEADLMPHEEEIGKDDFVVVDLQRLDDSTGTPIIGEKEADVSFFLDDERLKDELRDALLGSQVGDTLRVRLTHEPEPEEPSTIIRPGSERAQHAHTHAYQVVVKEVKRRDLPELSDEFVQEITEGELDDVEALREEVRTRRERMWEQERRDFLESGIMERMLELHPVPVPDAIIDTFLDAFVEDVKQRNDGDLPDDFDEAAFRQHNRAEAEQQARWMLINDAVIDDYDLEVTAEDEDAFFDKEAERGQLDARYLRQFYESRPSLMDRLEQRILSEKVFDVLAEQFAFDEKTVEDIEEEMAERRAAEQTQEGAPSAAEKGAGIVAGGIE